jgi:hypothetical protein
VEPPGAANTVQNLLFVHYCLMPTSSNLAQVIVVWVNNRPIATALILVTISIAYMNLESDSLTMNTHGQLQYITPVTPVQQGLEWKCPDIAPTFHNLLSPLLQTAVAANWRPVFGFSCKNLLIPLRFTSGLRDTSLLPREPHSGSLLEYYYVIGKCFENNS